MKVAGRALRQNFVPGLVYCIYKLGNQLTAGSIQVQLGPHVLPLREQAKVLCRKLSQLFASNHILKKAFVLRPASNHLTCEVTQFMVSLMVRWWSDVPGNHFLIRALSVAKQKKWPLAERFTMPEGYTPNFSKGHSAGQTFLFGSANISGDHWATTRSKFFFNLRLAKKHELVALAWPERQINSWVSIQVPRSHFGAAHFWSERQPDIHLEPAPCRPVEPWTQTHPKSLNCAALPFGAFWSVMAFLTWTALVASMSRGQVTYAWSRCILMKLPSNSETRLWLTCFLLQVQNQHQVSRLCRPCRLLAICCGLPYVELPNLNPDIFAALSLCQVAFLATRNSGWSSLMILMRKTRVPRGFKLIWVNPPAFAHRWHLRHMACGCQNPFKCTDSVTQLTMCVSNCLNHGDQWIKVSSLKHLKLLRFPLCPTVFKAMLLWGRWIR